MMSLSGLRTLRRCISLRSSRIGRTLPLLAFKNDITMRNTRTIEFASRSLSNQPYGLSQQEADSFSLLSTSYLLFLDRLAETGDIDLMIQTLKDVSVDDSTFFDSLNVLLREVVRNNLYESKFKEPYEQSVLQCNDYTTTQAMVHTMININICPSSNLLKTVSTNFCENNNASSVMELIKAMQKQRFTVPKPMYVLLFNLYQTKRKSARLLELFTMMNSQLGMVLDLEIYEKMVEHLIRDKRYLDARKILKISTENKLTNYRHFELELLLNLKLNDHDSVLRTLSEAFSFNHTIDEHVANLVMKSCFESIKTKQSEITEQETINLNFREINKLESNHKDGANTDSNESTKILTVIDRNEKVLESLQTQLQNIVRDVESISSNLVYQERGSVEAFTKMIRHWRAAGPTQRDRLEMVLIEMAKCGIEPKPGIYREILNLNHSYLHNYRGRKPKIFRVEKVPFENAFKIINKDKENKENKEIEKVMKSEIQINLDEQETDNFLIEKIREMNKNNGLKSLVNLSSAIACLSHTKNKEIIFELFTNNINDVIKNTKKITGIKEPEKSSKKSWQVRKVPVEGKFNIITISDSSIQTVWMKFLGDFHNICYHQKKENCDKMNKIDKFDIVEKSKEFLSQYFNEDTLKLILFHSNLVSFALKTPNTKLNFPTLLTNNLLDSISQPKLRSNFPKSQHESKSEKAIYQITHVPKSIYWSGVPYTMHYNYALQSCHNASEIDDLHYLICLMHYHVRLNRQKNYLDVDTKKETAIMPAIAERPNATSYLLLIHAMLNKNREDEDEYSTERTRNRDKRARLKMKIKNRVSNKNEYDLFSLAVDFAHKIRTNNHVSGALGNDIDDDYWKRKYSNFAIEKTLQKGFALTVRNATYGPLLEDDVHTIKNLINYDPNNFNVNNINKNEIYKMDANGIMQFRKDNLRDAISIFDTISVCGFPHPNYNYQNLLVAILSLNTETLTKIEKNDNNSEYSNFDTMKKYNVMSNGNNRCGNNNNNNNNDDNNNANNNDDEYGNYNDNMNDNNNNNNNNNNGDDQIDQNIENYDYYYDDDYYYEDIDVSKKDEKVRNILMSENTIGEDSLEYLEQAVDLFEGIVAVKRWSLLDILLRKKLLTDVINSKNHNLIHRLIACSPSYFLRSSRLSPNHVKTVLHSLSELGEYETLVKYFISFSKSSKEEVNEIFLNMENWKILANSLAILKDKELINKNGNEYNDNINNIDNNENEENFDIEMNNKNIKKSPGNDVLNVQNTSSNFLNFLDRKTTENYDDENEEHERAEIKKGAKYEITEIDELIFTVFDNLSEIRFFVDDDDLVRNVADILIDQNLLRHTQFLLKMAIKDRNKFCTPPFKNSEYHRKSLKNSWQKNETLEGIEDELESYLNFISSRM